MVRERPRVSKTFSKTISSLKDTRQKAWTEVRVNRSHSRVLNRPHSSVLTNSHGPTKLIAEGNCFLSSWQKRCWWMPPSAGKMSSIPQRPSCPRKKTSHRPYQEKCHQQTASMSFSLHILTKPEERHWNSIPTQQYVLSGVRAEKAAVLACCKTVWAERCCKTD